MAKPIMSNHKAQILALCLFIICVAIMFSIKSWWPEVLLVIGIPLALKQYLNGHRFDMISSLIVFVGGYITVKFKIAWEVVLPVIFTLGGLYILLREFFTSSKTEVEKEIDINEEIKEEDEDH